MIKLIGACLTLAACGNMGFTWARVYEKRPQQLSAIEGAMGLLETEIMYGATPLPEAMNVVAKNCDPEVAALFKYTADELGKLEGITAAEAWDLAAGRFYPGSALNDRDINILRRFGASLGASDRDDQVKHLVMTKSQLRLAVAQAEAEARKNSTVYKYLGFLGGVLMVLVLY